MAFPTPDDLTGIPVWTSFVLAQAQAAAMAQIPAHAVAISVKIDGTNVRFTFQMTRVTAEDEADMYDLVDTFWDLAGDEVDLTYGHRLVTAVRPWEDGEFGLYRLNHRLPVGGVPPTPASDDDNEGTPVQYEAPIYGHPDDPYPWIARPSRAK
ncbi:MAG: hypothetical protein LBH76_08685 [Propionibacteriaceae bacterium]|jgi:hypothetical protein|nr:hypothetical protein [Propionibacteriaceae bacterium]